MGFVDEQHADTDPVEVGGFRVDRGFGERGELCVEFRDPLLQRALPTTVESLIKVAAGQFADPVPQLGGLCVGVQRDCFEHIVRADHCVEVPGRRPRRELAHTILVGVTRAQHTCLRVQA